MQPVRRLGRYLLIEPLARGGMGEVWLARPEAVPGAPPLCVVKTLREGLVSDAEARTRFVDESRVALLLSHPCVCRTVDAGCVGETLFLALEVVEGIDVRHLAARAAKAGRPLDAALALWTVGCAADGLAFAHGARHPVTGAPLGIVHRDISPQNLMCGVDGTVRVIDFGLALSSLKEARTERDVVLGKLAYMPPEQAAGGTLDARSDVFSLGVVLYELLTGERYWGELSHEQIWRRAGLGSYTPPALERLPDELAAVVAAAIAGKAANRTASAARLRDAIARLLAQRGGVGQAALRLGALVEELAQPELARIQAARAASDTLPPDRSSPVMSIALEEVRAIEAMLLQEAPPPPTLTMQPTTLPDAVTAPDGALANAPTLIRAATDPGAPPVAQPPTMANATRTDRLARGRAASVWWAAGAAAGLLGALAVAAVVWAPTTGRDSSFAAAPLAAPPQPVAVEPVAVEPVAVEPVAVEPVAVESVAVEPTQPRPAPPAPPAPLVEHRPDERAPLLDARKARPAARLSALMGKLDGCELVCARTLRSTTTDLDRLAGDREQSVRALINQCLVQCGSQR